MCLYQYDQANGHCNQKNVYDPQIFVNEIDKTRI